MQAPAQTLSPSSSSSPTRPESVAPAAHPLLPETDPEALKLRRLIDSGHAPEALQQLDAKASGPAPPQYLSRLRGLAFYSQAKLPEADAAFAAALTQNPHDQEAAQMRGLTLFRLGRPAAAIPLLEGAQLWGSETKVDPSYILALCYLDTRRYDDARRAFAAQYDFPADSASGYLLAARMLLRREFLPVAKEFATKALSLDPQLPLAHALLGEIALAGNHVEDAISELNLERTRDPLDGAVYDRLGDAYYRSGDYPNAQRALQRALLLEPNSTGPYILLGKVLLKRQDPLGAATYLERARTMDPANYRTHSLLGQAYRSLGRQEDASREVQAAQTLQAASEPKLQGVQ
ncbi:MAG: hypothetical protein NVSMB3_05320 [Acidobacteriaceae bacterium]